MKKQIFIDRTEKTRICKEFNVSNVTLWNALTFQTDSAKAKMLRKVALERGGKMGGEGTQQYTAKCETTFQTSDNTMAQVFSERVKLVANTGTGEIEVFVDNKPKSKYVHLSIPQFMNLQQEVQNMAHNLK